MIITLIIVGCKPVKPLEVQPVMDESLTSTRIVFWQNYGPRCRSFPSKLHADGSCDDGDATLFNSLLCYAGSVESCEAVKNAQGDDGRWYRSPRKEELKMQKNSFSRDQMMGVLLYLVSTKDRAGARKWLEWMENNRKCFINYVAPINGQTCAVSVTVSCPDSPDGTCAVTPAMWQLIAEVWRFLDLPLSYRMENPWSELGDFASLTSWITSDISTDDVAFIETITNAKGYRLHLKGVHVLLKKAMGKQSEKLDKIVGQLRQRQPENLFFKYLDHGANVQLAKELVQVCPNPTRMVGLRNQWAWERRDSEQAWNHSMGWDCYFLGRLMTQKSNGLHD